MHFDEFYRRSATGTVGKVYLQLEDTVLHRDCPSHSSDVVCLTFDRSQGRPRRPITAPMPLVNDILVCICVGRYHWELPKPQAEVSGSDAHGCWVSLGTTYFKLARGFNLSLEQT